MDTLPIYGLFIMIVKTIPHPLRGSPLGAAMRLQHKGALTFVVYALRELPLLGEPLRNPAFS